MKLIDLLNIFEIEVDAFYFSVEKTIKDDPEKFENYSIEKNFKDILLSQPVRELETMSQKVFFLNYYPIWACLYTLPVDEDDDESNMSMSPKFFWRIVPTEEKTKDLMMYWFFSKIHSGEKSIFQKRIDSFKETMDDAWDLPDDEEDEYKRNV